MTFSIAGAAVSLAILLPNLLLVAFPPRDLVKLPDAGLVATICERIGQVGCLVLPFLVGGAGGLSWWIVPVVLAVGGYLALWVRYLVGRRMVDLYRPLGFGSLMSRSLRFRSLGPRPAGQATVGVPVPMAVFPVVAFLVTAGWLDSVFVALAAVVFAAGHLPNSWVAWRAIRSDSVSDSVSG